MPDRDEFPRPKTFTVATYGNFSHNKASEMTTRAVDVILEEGFHLISSLLGVLNAKGPIQLNSAFQEFSQKAYGVLRLENPT